MKELEKIWNGCIEINKNYEKLIKQSMEIIEKHLEDISNGKETKFSGFAELTNLENLRKQNINNLITIKLHSKEENYLINTNKEN